MGGGFDFGLMSSFLWLQRLMSWLSRFMWWIMDVNFKVDVVVHGCQG